MEKKKVIYILVIFIIGLIFLSGTFAYYRWESDTASDTEVTLTLEKEYSCSADGGGNITSTDAVIAPTNCMDSTHAIQRELTVTPTLIRDDININTTLYLQVDLLDSGLSNSENFRYAITTSNTSCETGVISAGNFKGLTIGDQVRILNENYNTSIPQKYYLYIWLDKEETSSSTMNQKFKLSITGSCTDEVKPEEPVLDDGMIPVKISNNGTVTTVALTDSSWYNYSNKKWANAVLVKESGTQLRSYYKNNPGKTIPESDILAYYVWIPRYKYKISEMFCSEVANPNEEEHTGCYKYSMSSEDKTKFINWWYSEFGSYLNSSYGVEYTFQRATQDVETMLNTGSVYIEEEDWVFSLLDQITYYNTNSDPDINYESTFMSNNKINLPRTIDISFESKNDSTLTGDAVNTYRTHPAFTFGTENISGIWVGKFETGHSILSSVATSNNLSCTDENCTNADGLIIKPNVVSLRENNVSNQFYASRSMSRNNNPFGFNVSTTDTHMMKNSEWGAVAYLSHSEYGINGEIRRNNNLHYTTGCGASSETGSNTSTSACQIAYAGASSYPQSTTGNITGVFDMSGGTMEYVMGNYNNTISSAGFTIMPSSKYYDVYSISSMSSCTIGTCGGHALFETAGWYSDAQFFVNAGYPWFLRGGHYSSGSGAGAWYSVQDNGDASDNGFRSVAIVGA